MGNLFEKPITNYQDFRKAIIERDHNCIITRAHAAECTLTYIIPNLENQFDTSNAILLNRILHKSFNEGLFSIHPLKKIMVVRKDVTNVLIREYENNEVLDVKPETIINLKKHFLNTHGRNFDTLVELSHIPNHQPVKKTGFSIMEFIGYNN